MNKSEIALNSKLKKLIAKVDEANKLPAFNEANMRVYRSATSALAWFVVKHADKIRITNAKS